MINNFFFTRLSFKFKNINTITESFARVLKCIINDLHFVKDELIDLRSKEMAH